MKHRKLRIAWSVAWGITVLLLIALWIRSYFRTYVVLTRYQSFVCGILSSYGELGLEIGKDRYHRADLFMEGRQIHIESSQRMNSWEPEKHRPLLDICGFRLRNYLLNTRGDPRLNFALPFWFASSICVMSIALPWIPWSVRFSIRTMLIIMTLTAIAVSFAVAYR
jgi:hypothetical protein